MQQQWQETVPQNGAQEEAPADPSAPTSLYVPSTFEQKARLTINVPEDARVLLNSVAMTSAGEVRKFISPVLPGQGPYYYHIQVEVTRNGEKQTVDHQQMVQPGRSFEVSFAEREGSLVFVAPENSNEIASR